MRIPEPVIYIFILADDIVGSYEFDINEILDKKRYNTWQFVHIYGSPLSKSIFTIENLFYKKMNENP